MAKIDSDVLGQFFREHRINKTIQDVENFGNQLPSTSQRLPKSHHSASRQVTPNLQVGSVKWAVQRLKSYSIEDRYKEIYGSQWRQGQQAFRAKLRRFFNEQCVITGTPGKTILDAAHIHPHADQGSMNESNGLLLRTDIHRLFDANLLGIDPETHVVYVAAAYQTPYKNIHNKPIKLDERTNHDALRARYEQFLLENGGTV